MITEDYVSFEIAKLLKEKGFDRYPLFPCYKEDSGEFIDIPTTLDTINYCFIPAPTLQMAMKWLRLVHHITIGIAFSLHLITYEIQKDEEFITAIGSSRSYENMVEEAIKYCLENLI